MLSESPAPITYSSLLDWSVWPANAVLDAALRAGRSRGLGRQAARSGARGQHEAGEERDDKRDETPRRNHADLGTLAVRNGGEW